MEDEKGKILVGLARSAVYYFLEHGKLIEPPEKDWLFKKSGVFVSIYEFPTRDLRGCIGYPLPVFALGEATVRAAVAAAVDDPRFPPLEKHELANVVFEVSVLTEPVEINVEKRKELHNDVKVGEDGLIVETPHGSGLLLPQVPIEFGWSAEEFLSHLCIKAGLNPTYWVYGEMRLFRFGAEVFAETSPEGDVKRINLFERKC
ncbi:MAG: TIGR00296 family protein [Candidatus Caldarchaeum sp.]|nr:TIGR00296 family protein [Candidatus Caldarchaeum sp.]